jgi:hypothetical protein
MAEVTEELKVLPVASVMIASDAGRLDGVGVGSVFVGPPIVVNVVSFYLVSGRGRAKDKVAREFDARHIS